MVYILLNAALTIFLGLFTYRVDKKRKTDTFEVSGFAIALLLTAIEAGMFFLTLLCKNLIYDTFTFQFMRLEFRLLFLLQEQLGYKRSGLSFIYFLTILIIICR